MDQRYPPHKLEILVVDGGSTDRTREIVRKLAEEDPRVQLVDNPGRFPSAGMNEGIKRAKGTVIVRLDAHAEYAANYVIASVEALRRTGAANVGAAARGRYKNPFQRALCAALGSRLGVGGSAYRDADREGFVETVWGGAFRREAFERVGLFDAKARTNEDAELNQRIIEAGGSIFLSRDVVAFYYPRSSLRALWHQYFSYGQGRARTLLRRGRLLSPRPLIPFAMVTIFAVLASIALLLPEAWPLFALAMLGYSTIIAAESIRIARKNDPRILPRLLVIFPAMHFAHGLGVWQTLLKSTFNDVDTSAPERLTASS
jgi:glycosyltransferase involved in cell wall biosynthesis